MIERENSDGRGQWKQNSSFSFVFALLLFPLQLHVTFGFRSGQTTELEKCNKEL
jgi:hypothetical protein